MIHQCYCKQEIWEKTDANHNTAELPSAFLDTSMASSIASGSNVTEHAPMSAQIVNNPPVSPLFTTNPSNQLDMRGEDGARTGPDEAQPKRAERGLACATQRPVVGRTRPAGAAYAAGSTCLRGDDRCPASTVAVVTGETVARGETARGVRGGLEQRG